MNGIDPMGDLQAIATKTDELTRRGDIEAALDRLEYLMEVLDPELQEPAYGLIEQLRRKLSRAGP
jgi:hypothetical protein